MWYMTRLRTKLLMFWCTHQEVWYFPDKWTSLILNESVQKPNSKFELIVAEIDTSTDNQKLLQIFPTVDTAMINVAQH